jgi:hypothetical protein
VGAPRARAAGRSAGDAAVGGVPDLVAIAPRSAPAVTSRANPIVYAASKNTYGFADAGAGSLAITSHAVTASDVYSETYEIHGTYTLTAPIYPASAADPVTVSITF